VLFFGAPFSLPLKTVKDSVEGIVKMQAFGARDVRDVDLSKRCKDELRV
jgi:hypothetical protein